MKDHIERKELKRIIRDAVEGIISDKKIASMMYYKIIHRVEDELDELSEDPEEARKRRLYT